MAIDDDIKIAHDDQLRKLDELEQRLNDEEGMHNQALQNIAQERQTLRTIREQLTGNGQPTSAYY